MTTNDYVKLTAEDSVAHVVANAGTWILTGGVIYVHLTDGRAPDANVHVYRSMASAYSARDSISIYLEGIEFQGGPNGACYFRNASATGNLNVYAKNCKFKYSAATGGFATEGTTLSVCQDCESARNDNDGYNYHVRNTVVPDAIEINCIGRHSNPTGDSDNNGSSIHDGGRILRLNGKYHDTYGSQIVDVTHSLSWDLGIQAYNGLETGQANFEIDGVMWLDTCTSYGHAASGYDLKVAGAGHALYHRNLMSGGDFSNSGATLETY